MLNGRDINISVPTPRLVQAPLLAATTPSESATFACKIKSMVTNCSSCARVAITGSGMVTLLNTLRDVPVNGYALWDAMVCILLGATPTTVTEAAMATEIVAYRSTAWPAALSSEITAGAIVTLLQGGGPMPLTSARPALVAFLADLVGTTGTPEAALHAAHAALVFKICTESTKDVCVALSMLPRSTREIVSHVCKGNVTKDDVLRAFPRDLPGGTLCDLLLMLCEPNSGGPLQLLPPYGALMGALLSFSGTILVRITRGQWVLDEELRDRLRFFGEHHYTLLESYAPLACELSHAKLASFASNGIGVRLSGSLGISPPRSIAEMTTVPAFATILSLLSKQEETSAQVAGRLSPSHVTFLTALVGERAGNTSYKQRLYAATLGIQVVHWLRIVEAHVYLPKAEFSAIVEHALGAAVAVWIREGLPTRLGSVLVPIMPTRPGAHWQ